MCTNTDYYQLYLSKCQSGLPVCFRARGTNRYGLHLGTPAKDHPEAEVSMIYARLDRPTGRLLLHFLQPALKRERDYLTIPEECPISPSVARLLGLGRGRHVLRPGKYLLLTDEFFATASVGLRAVEATQKAPSQYNHASRLRSVQN